MPLSSALRTEYAELANRYLDSFPAEQMNDFIDIREALMSIIEPSVEHQVSPLLQGRVTSVNEIILSPEMFVKNETEYAEFKEIILRRVAAKIEELDLLSLQDREKYIINQKLIKESAEQNYAKMDKVVCPLEGTEKHVLSHYEWLIEEQERFTREAAARRDAPQPLQRHNASYGLQSFRDLMSHTESSALPMDSAPSYEDDDK